MKKKIETEDCKVTAMAVKDALEVLSGKWKFVILAALQQRKFRFKELADFVGITPRMLSRELQILEINQLVSRTVIDTKPVSVEYAMTAHGDSLKTVIMSLKEWGLKHRQFVMKGGKTIRK